MSILSSAKEIYIVGIKGSAMSNLAVILSQMGKKVKGCDTDEEFITDPILSKYGIISSVGFDASLLSSTTDLVVYSAAHGGKNNPIVVEAAKKGIPTTAQAELLGELISGFKTSIGVSGCHGKTTTSSLFAYALKRLGRKPGYLIGVPFFNDFPGGGYEGDNTYFVFEADEYGVNPPEDKTPKLDFLKPTHIICTNIDFDHPDVYANLDETKNAFLRFFRNGRLFLCADDPNIKSILPNIPRERYQTFGYAKGADLQIQNSRVGTQYTQFDLYYKGEPLGTFASSLYGPKNISNVAGVVLALIELGFEVEAVRNAVRDFSQVKRRFELIFRKDGSYLFDDYGHHPAEIAATIEAARARFGDKRILIIFQPHTYSRTQSLKKEFAQALSAADYSLIAPIFPSAREKADGFKVTSNDIEKEAGILGSDRVLAYGSKEELLRALVKFVRKGDVVMTVGAGDIYKLKDDIIQILSRL